MLIPYGKLAVRVPREAGRDELIVIQKGDLRTLGAHVADSFLRWQKQKRNHTFNNIVSPIVDPAQMDRERARGKPTDITIPFRGSIRRSFLSFDVVAMNDPFRLTAIE